MLMNTNEWRQHGPIAKRLWSNSLTQPEKFPPCHNFTAQTRCFGIFLFLALSEERPLLMMLFALRESSFRISKALSLRGKSPADGYL
jgi:hypothetical protein